MRQSYELRRDKKKGRPDGRPFPCAAKDYSVVAIGALVALA
jgi:hypothetical protein